MSSTIILSQYPIPSIDRDKLKDLGIRDTEYLIVSNIIHSGYLSLFLQLRRINCARLIIYLASSQNETMLPVLRLMSVLIRADERCLMWSNKQGFEKWKVHQVIGDTFALLFSFLRALFCTFISLLYVLKINQSGRIKVSIKRSLQAKRILYLRPTLWNGLRVGGAASHARGIISGLLDLGYFIDCVADDAFTEIPKGKGCVDIVRSTSAYVVPRELNYFSFQSVVFAYVKKKFGSHYTGVIYQRISIGSIAGVVLSRFWRVPLVLEYNGSESWLAKNWSSPFFFNRLVNFVELSLLRHAHLIVTVSSALKKELTERGLPDDRIIACPNGVNSSDFLGDQRKSQKWLEERAALGFTEDDLIFTFVGSFGHWHGAKLLAEIIDSIVSGTALHTETIKFLFVGQGVEFDSVRAMLDLHIRSGRVVMTGMVEHTAVPRLLAISDVCLAPTLENADGSEFFGSPTKLFEYMAAGKPVIASAVGQVEDVLRGSPYLENLPADPMFDMAGANMDQAIGLLFSPGDHGQLKRAILMLAQNEEVRLKMGALGAARAESAYTWQAHVMAVMTRLDDIGRATDNDVTTVLINALHSKSGGGVTYLRNILPYLTAMPELDVHVALHRSQLTLFEDILIGSTPHYYDVEGGLAGILIAEQFSLLSTSRQISADVVFSVANYGPLLVRNGCLLLRNSLDVATVERRLGKLLYWGIIYAATISSALLARRVIAVSSYARDSSFRGVFKGLRGKTVIVPHGVAASFFDIKRQPSDSPFLLAVSDIYVQKNMHTLIRSFADLHQEMPTLILKIAGKPIDREYYQRLQNIVDELGISESVQFVGHVSGDDLRKLYGTCSVFVFSSKVETFGNPLVEAMASGCPIVCSNTSAMPGVAGDAVRFVDPDDKDQMVREISAFLKDPALCDEYSARARSRGHVFSWEKTARDTANVLLRSVN